jgi:hypothetical protein
LKTENEVKIEFVNKKHKILVLKLISTKKKPSSNSHFELANLVGISLRIKFSLAEVVIYELQTSQEVA